jgi:hypothetical protein
LATEIVADKRLWLYSIDIWGMPYAFEQAPDAFVALITAPKRRGNYLSGFRYQFARILVQQGDVRAVAMIQEIWRRENRNRSFNIAGGLREVVDLAFQVRDCAEVRVLWDELLEEVCDDDELLRLTVSAVDCNGGAWLHERCLEGVRSNVLGQIARAAVLAGAAEFKDVLLLAQARTEEFSAWVAVAIAFGSKLLVNAERARYWNEQFWNADNWCAALAGWTLYLEHVDMRHQMRRNKGASGDCSGPVHEQRRRYAKANHEDVRNRAGESAKALKKTLYGASLPSGIGRWESSRHNL